MSLEDNLNYVKPCLATVLVLAFTSTKAASKDWSRHFGEVEKGSRRSRGRASLITPAFPLAELTPQKLASRKPAVGAGKREEVIFYIRTVNHSSMLCIFPMVVWLPGWLAQRAADGGRVRVCV